jgi:thiol-disulfide isomerase/thioredoxin
MSWSLATSAGVIVAALVVAVLIGVLVNRRSGVLREGRGPVEVDTTDLGLSDSGPTVVHFSASWCGPCAAVRRVVDQVCGDLPGVSHVEIDLDADPGAAQRFSVLSLPTTFVFDDDGRQRYRTSGVPTPADLRSALIPLLA